MVNKVTLRQAAEQALEVLDMARIEFDYHGNPLDSSDAAVLFAVATLRQALESEQEAVNKVAAQKQDEPVGKTVLMPGTNGFTMACFHASDVPVDTELYTAPQPAQQPLTQELLHSLWLHTPVDYYTDNESIFKQAARAIERAHRIGCDK